MKTQKEINNTSKHTTMKTLKALFAAIIFIGFTTGAVAQDQSEATISASAEIFRVLEIERRADLNFGVIFLGQTATLNPQNDTRDNVGSLGQEEEFGLFSVSGNPNAEFSVTLPGSITLNHSEGSETGSINLSLADYYGYSTTDSYDAEEVTQINDGNSANLNDNGDGYIWVGGQIDLTGTSPENGVYSGDIKVTVDYNTF